MPDTAQDYTSDDIMDAISEALKAGNLADAAALMHLLALKDPGAAEAIHDWVKELTDG